MEVIIERKIYIWLDEVRQRIRNIHNGRIPYESLTYGELITFINNEGLTLCTPQIKESNEKGKTR